MSERVAVVGAGIAGYGYAVDVLARAAEKR